MPPPPPCAGAASVSTTSWSWNSATPLTPTGSTGSTAPSSWATRILPRHLFFSRHWVVKDWSVLDDALLREEQQYLATNPHERQLREIFAAARIEYGRIDYSLRDGEMQVWEINTNPIIIGMGPARARSEAPSGRGAACAPRCARPGRG